MHLLRPRRLKGRKIPRWETCSQFSINNLSYRRDLTATCCKKEKTYLEFLVPLPRKLWSPSETYNQIPFQIETKSTCMQKGNTLRSLYLATIPSGLELNILLNWFNEMKLWLPFAASVKDLENETFERWKMGRKPKIPSSKCFSNSLHLLGIGNYLTLPLSNYFLCDEKNQCVLFSFLREKFVFAFQQEQNKSPHANIKKHQKKVVLPFPPQSC